MQSRIRFANHCQLAGVSLAIGLLGLLLIAFPAVARDRQQTAAADFSQQVVNLEYDVVKTAMPHSVEAGGLVTYTIDYQGDGLHEEYIIIDALPEGTKYVRCSPDCAGNNRRVTWTVLESSGAVTLVLEVLTPTAETTITNIVSVGTMTETGAVDQLESPVVSSGPPSSTATIDPDRVGMGRTIPVDWAATDDGSGLARVVLYYRYGQQGWQETTYKATHLSGMEEQGRFDFEPTRGAGRYCFQTVATDAAGLVEQEPQAGDVGDDCTEVSNLFVYLPLALRNHGPQLSGSLEVSPGTAYPGRTLAYTVTVENAGSAPAIDVTLNNSIPEQTVLADSAPVGCEYLTSTREIVWNGDLAPNDTQTCAFTVTINTAAAGTIEDDATLDAPFLQAPVLLSTTTPIATWSRGTGSWPTPGVVVYSLALCPDQCDIIYAGTKDAGVWKSTDGGISWTATALADQMVWGIAVEPATEEISACQTVYATTWGQGVMKSVDGGENWAPFNDGLDDPYIYTVVIGPDYTIYAGTFANGVYKRTAGGVGWTPAGTELAGKEVDALTIDATNAANPIIYASTWGSGVYTSIDSGNSWTQKKEGLEGAMNVYAVAFDPRHSNILYAATYENGVYHSDNAAASWVPSWSEGRPAFAVAVDQVGIAYAGTNGEQSGIGIYQRLSEAWLPIYPQPYTAPIVRAIAVAPATCQLDRLWIGTTDGVWWYGAPLSQTE